MRKDIAILGAAVLSFGVGGYILEWARALGKLPAQFALTIEATEGGTTDPEPKTYTYAEATNVSVTAVVFDGYEFTGWYLDGEYQHASLTISVSVTEQHLLIASFQLIGAPPLLPAYIRPIQNCQTEEWWKATRVENRCLYLDPLQQSQGYIKFKICDAAGNGVSGQHLAIYTDANPDELGYGNVYINGAEHTGVNPLILQSNAEGVVVAKIGYKWIEPGSNYEYTIGTGAKAHYICLAGVLEGDKYPIFDGDCSLIVPCYWTSITRMKHPIFRNINYIHAYWVDNPNLPVWGDATADCMVKIDDKLYIGT